MNTANHPKCHRAHRGLFRAVSFVAVGFMLVAGCTRGDGKIYGKVEGRITFQGQPLREATLLFQQPEQQIFVQTKTNQDGRYDFSTLKGGGLPVGNYQVSVQRSIAVSVPGPKPPLQPFPPIDPKYTNPDTSGLRIEVKPGENRFDADLKTKL